MKVHADDIIKFVFDRLGKDPTDEMIAQASHHCFAAFLGVVQSIRDPSIRERFLKERDAKMANVMRMMTEALDAVEEGKLEVSPRRNN
jgi:hypothetical protein